MSNTVTQAHATLISFAESIMEGRVFKRSPAPRWKFKARISSEMDYNFEIRPVMEEPLGNGIYVASNALRVTTVISTPMGSSCDVPKADRRLGGFYWGDALPQLPGNWQQALETICAAIIERDLGHVSNPNACCFCDKRLTTKASRAAGYGPDCAATFNLPWDAETIAAAIKARETRNRKSLKSIECVLVDPAQQGILYEAMTGARIPDITVVTVLHGEGWSPDSPELRARWFRPLSMSIEGDRLEIRMAGRGFNSHGTVWLKSRPVLILVGRHDEALQGITDWSDAHALGAPVLYANDTRPMADFVAQWEARRAARTA